MAAQSCKILRYHPLSHDASPHDSSPIEGEQKSNELPRANIAAAAATAVIRVSQSPLQLPQRERPHIHQRRIRWRLHHNFDARRDVNCSDALSVPDAGDFENNFALFAAHAVKCTGHIAQTALSEATS